MMRFDDLLSTIETLHREDLQRWVDQAWISPLSEGGTLHFSDMECARVRLICTMRYEWEVEEETMPVVLSLLDQLYETRRELNVLAAAVAAQDSDVRNAILRVVQAEAGRGSD